MKILPSGVRETGALVRKPTLLILALCAIPLSGCIPVPLALADPEPFTAQRMTSIHSGETTRDRVRALFADWTYETDAGPQTAHLEPQMLEDGRSWVFSLPRQLGDLGVVGLFASPYGLAPGLIGKEDHYEDFRVLFEFNDDATVARFRIAGDRTPCVAGGACYHQGHLQLIADEAPDAGARVGPVASDRCVIYAYASDDFELPVTVTDGTHSGWLFAKGSFVRFDVAPGSQAPSAEYDNVPASAAAMPSRCAGGEVQYVALRPQAAVIEALPETPSTGERAIKRGYRIERLVPVQASVPHRPPSLWTQCTAADPCRDLAILDTGVPWHRQRSVVIVAAAEQSPDIASHLLVHPRVHTVELREYAGPGRHDTFEMKAGHRYETKYVQFLCRKHSETEDSLKGQVCKDSPDIVTYPRWVDTTWFEDAATTRVVAGQKWCSSDADCPESQCTVQAGQPRVCDIPELQCTYGERCVRR